MGRKIPGKKHRTVKDPYKQRAERFASIKTKINQPPTNPDDQHIPSSLKELFNWKEKFNRKANKEANAKDDEKKFKKKKSGAFELTNTSTSNPVKNLKIMKGESKKSFNIRINEAIKGLKHESVTYKDLDKLPKEKKIRENDDDKPKFKRKKKIVEPQLNKNQKRALKEKTKKEEYKQNQEFDQMWQVKYDNIKFGEVVHEPPSLKIKPRKAEVIDGAPRPARKDLLLNQLFESKLDAKVLPSSKANQKSAKTNKGLNLQGKRKDLPNNVRRKLEESQKAAIEAYRLLKMQKANDRK